MTLGRDKLLHAAAGAAIAVITALAWNFAVGPWWWLAGIGAAALAGIGKELYDRRDYGVFDPQDVVATVIGGLLCLLLQVVL